mmetsp:Transcript_9460/g.22822  ORF Transcript_9460/g.22822 Transcript_9460/m.22822 type:complete len:115 (+) Transcript_9460:131-475(+)
MTMASVAPRPLKRGSGDDGSGSFKTQRWSDTITIHAVSTFSGYTAQLQVSVHMKVHQLRQSIAEGCEVPAHLIRIFVNPTGTQGLQILDDDEATIGSFRLQDGAEVHAMPRMLR